MEVFGKECDVLTVGIFIVLAVMWFFLKAKILQLILWIWTRFATEKNVSEEDIQKDITEMKETTEQIIENWIGMTKLVAQIQDDQNNFIDRLPILLEEKLNEILKQALDYVNVALEDAFQRNEKRNIEMRLTIQNMQEDIQSMKSFLRKLDQKSYNEFNGKASAGGENETDDYNTEIGEVTHPQKNAIEYDTSKVIAAVKECLTNLLKDAKLNFSIDREEENRELEIILSKLAADREDIKKTILQAFCIAAEQAKKNYDQFREIGEEGLKYIAVLNGNTNNLLQLKLDETDDVLKNVLGIISHQKVDIDTMRNVLENMDGQFNELHEKLTQIYQINIEHCAEIALNLEKTSNNWAQNVEKIEKMIKQLCNDTSHVKQMFEEIKDLTQKRDADNDGENEKSEITRYDPTDNSALSQKQENVIFVYSCWERMRKTSCTVESECHSICKLILGLEQKLLSLNESVEKLDEFIRGLNLEVLADRALSINYDDSAEIVDGMVQTNQGHAGDGKSQVIHSIASKWKNVPQLNGMQNGAAISNAMRLADIILKNVCERVNHEDGENFMQSKPVSASASTDKSHPTTDEENLTQNPTEPEVHKADTVKTKQKNN